MDPFRLSNGRLMAEGVSLETIAETYGTPCYVYSRAALEENWRAFDAAFAGHDHLVCYAVKASSNIGLLNLLARLGSGFDIVSGGELERVLRAGGDPRKVVFSGVGKTAEEMRRALHAGIYCFNVESVAELERLAEVARRQQMRAPVSLRVNPDIDARTHPYISTGLKTSKFGIDIDAAAAIYARAAQIPSIAIRGVACHIGSQLTAVAPAQAALERVLALVEQLRRRGIACTHVDVGGGLGIRYRDEQPPAPAAYTEAILETLGERNLKVLIEPGRAIAGPAGILLTRVEYLKFGGHKNFAIVDAAMNDLLRPALYGAWHDITPVVPRPGAAAVIVDVVGPVCESGDFLGSDRQLAVEPGDLLAVGAAGAYGFTMASNYNSRPRAPEVLVDGTATHLLRRRESVDDLLAGESVPP